MIMSYINLPTKLDDTIVKYLYNYYHYVCLNHFLLDDVTGQLGTSWTLHYTTITISVLNLPTELEDTTQICMYINFHIVSQFLPDAPIWR